MHCDYELEFYSVASIDFYANGTIDYNERQTSNYSFNYNLVIGYDNYAGYDYMVMTNIGLKL